MGLINRLKFEELRIAVINELKEFVPPDHYASLSAKNEAELSRLDWMLWRLIDENLSRFPMKITARQVAAKHLLIYMALVTSAALKIEVDEKQSNLSKKDKEVIKNNRDEFQGLHNSLMGQLSNWISYLPENEAKPFEKEFFVISERGNLIENANREFNNREAELIAAFDPVGNEALEKMFPADKKWKSWTNKAKEFGLDVARVGRGRYNPYLAGKWFLSKNEEGWDLARIYRVLKSNLPTRSKDKADLLENYD